MSIDNFPRVCYYRLKTINFPFSYGKIERMFDLILTILKGESNYIIMVIYFWFDLIMRYKAQG